MKKFLIFPILLTILSCSSADPAEYNDTIVDKVDSVIIYQAAFVNSMGGDDTLKIKKTYADLNTQTDKAIAEISKLPEYDDGAEYQKNTLKILNNLKNTNTTSGKAMTDIAVKVITAPKSVTAEEITEMNQVITHFDDTWAKNLQQFETTQDKYAKETGIVIEPKTAKKH